MGAVIEAQFSEWVSKLAELNVTVYSIGKIYMQIQMCLGPCHLQTCMKVFMLQTVARTASCGWPRLGSLLSVNGKIELFT